MILNQNTNRVSSISSAGGGFGDSNISTKRRISFGEKYK